MQIKATGTRPEEALGSISNQNIFQRSKTEPHTLEKYDPYNILGEKKPSGHFSLQNMGQRAPSAYIFEKKTGRKYAATYFSPHSSSNFPLTQEKGCMEAHNRKRKAKKNFIFLLKTRRTCLKSWMCNFPVRRFIF